MKQIKSTTAKQLITIGWRQMLSLPNLGVARIKAKIDTGARTSALQAFHCQEFQQSGKTLLFKAYTTNTNPLKSLPIKKLLIGKT